MKNLMTLKPLMALTALMALMSCRSTQVEKTVSTDTLRVVNLQRDSVYLRDSVFVSVMQQNDTIFYTKTVTKTAYRDRWRTDTVYKAKTDTVSVTKEAVKEKTVTRFPWWAKLVTVASIVWGGLCVAYVALKKM